MISKQRIFWSVMAVIGAVLPLWHLVPWLWADVSQIGFFWQQSTLNAPSRVVMADILWAAVAFIIFVVWRAVRTGKWRLLWAILPTCTIGLSCGLPLYLALMGDDD